MKYECTCTPMQVLPHMVRSPEVHPRYLSLLVSKKRIILASLYKYLTPAKSCDNHPVPIKRWRLKTLGLDINFGKIIYG